MKSFLINNKSGKPIVAWGSIPQGIHFEGEIPSGYSKAISPSTGIVVLDVDCKNNKNGYENIPHLIRLEIEETFNYKTASGNGHHYWIKYTGSKTLINRATKLGLDIRISDKGYVKYHHNIDIRQCTSLIKEASPKLNKFLEKLFS